MNLDPERVADARERAIEDLNLASFHETMAKASRNRAGLLARTWGFQLPAESLDEPGASD